MKPVRIELEGFLSHRSTIVDLTDVQAAVLVGDNGAGKSAICDGITWALFGKRPRPGQPVNDRSTACRVEFEFEIQGRGRWKVIRERTRASGGKSSLQLLSHVPRPEGTEWGEWMPQGGAHLVESQRAIEDLLGLDYDTFLGSSFVGQGLADEFTRRRPHERKELLSRLLGLERYDELAQRARDAERQAAGEAAETQRRAEEIEDFLTGEEGAKSAAAAAGQGKDAATAALSEAEASLAGARKALEFARAKAADIARLREQLSHMRDKRETERRRAQEEAARTERERVGTETELEQGRTELEKLAQASRMATSLEADATAKALDAGAREGEATELRDKAAEAQASAHAALERANAANDRLQAATEQTEDLSRARGDASKCPTCEQLLTEEHRRRLVERLREEIQAASEARRGETGTHEHRTLEADGFRIKAEGKEREAQATRQEVAELREGAARAQAGADRIPEVTKQVDALGARLEELDTAKVELAETIEGLGRPTTEENEVSAKVEAAAAVEDRVARAAGDVDEAVRATDEARGRLTDAAAELGRAEEALRRYEEARRALESTTARHRELVDRRFVDGILAEAWGRNGIPALIIENAVPQIEEEAGRLLERFTDGRFQVALESQRATKAGEIRETLDVIVTADGAARPLEELSGGERQVVDLSLRIGLARLLAHRAGRPIECLILDEAFTALDAGRRQRAVEVLRGLLEEFPLLLAVTHDREFADAFPVRIQVANDGEGSRVEVAGAAEAA